MTDDEQFQALMVCAVLVGFGPPFRRDTREKITVAMEHETLKSACQEALVTSLADNPLGDDADPNLREFVGEVLRLYRSEP